MLQKGQDIEGTLAWKKKASTPFVPILSLIASQLSASQNP
jgi:hypothetical protein